MTARLVNQILLSARLDRGIGSFDEKSEAHKSDFNDQAGKQEQRLSTLRLLSESKLIAQNL